MEAKRLFFATENIPGTVVKIGCESGFGGVKDTVVPPVTCQLNGKWTSDKIPTCKACKQDNCVNCDGDITKCVECKVVGGVPMTINANGRCVMKYASCAAVLTANKDATNGIYDLTTNGKQYKTYCDFQIDNGGWQLIASVHEDNIAAKCNAQDRWTNTNGNGGRGNKGLGHWQNSNSVFGAPANAAKSDFKSIGYGLTNAKNVMIWHVPNGQPVDKLHGNALYQYHTSNNFLADYKGNLAGLYQKHPPVSQSHRCRQVIPTISYRTYPF